MKDLQFVYEKPQRPSLADRKRSRLVTSCDACRSKKIRCRQTGHGNGPCESCVASGTTCIYRERDKIRAQRGIADFTVARTDDKFSADLVPESVSSGPALVSVASASSPRSGSVNSPLSPTNEVPEVVQHEHLGLPSIATLLEETPFFQPGPLPLFDLNRPYYPNALLLPHFVSIFLEHAGAVFAFFDDEQLMNAAASASLAPLLANCIAAYAARFSDMILHPPGGRHLSGEPYLEAAKSLTSSRDISKVELLHAYILIAWTENGSGRASNFWKYGRSAAALAVELNIGSEDCIRLSPEEKEKNCLRSTFWSVAWLQIVSGLVVGEPPLFRLQDCNTNFPYPEVTMSGSYSRSRMYQTLKGLFMVMIKLQEIANAGKPTAPSSYRDTGLQQIRRSMLNFLRSSSLVEFNEENFREAEAYHESYFFSLTHVLTHSIIVITHCPSLFWVSQEFSGSAIADVPRLDIAWSSALATIDIHQSVIARTTKRQINVSSLFIPLSIARGALMMASAYGKGVTTELSISKEDFDRMNQSYLDESLQLLMNLSKYWASMQQVKIASQEVALCGIDTAPHIADTQSRPLLNFIRRSTTSTLPRSFVTNFNDSHSPYHHGNWQIHTIDTRQLSLSTNEYWQEPSLMYKQIANNETNTNANFVWDSDNRYYRSIPAMDPLPNAFLLTAQNFSSKELTLEQ